MKSNTVVYQGVNTEVKGKIISPKVVSSTPKSQEAFLKSLKPKGKRSV